MKRYIVLFILLCLVFTGACNRKLKSDTIVNDTKPSIEKDLIDEDTIDKDEVDISDEELNKPLVVETEKPAVVENINELDNTKIGWGLSVNTDGNTPGIPDLWKSLLKTYNGVYIGDTTKKEVFLTFDLGYEAGFTPSILDTLKENEVKAAFFFTGHFLTTQKVLVLRMISEGHIIGNHTENHPSIPTIPAAELKKEIKDLNLRVLNETNFKMTYFRPPSGEFSEKTLSIINSLGFKTIFWSLAFKDWEPLNGGPDESYTTVMSRLHNGAIILLHGTSKDNTLALDKIIKSIKEEGFEFKTLDQLTK